MQRAHNFNAGPAALPLPVLERARAELLDLGGSGMSVLEMSHRSKLFEGIRDRAEERVRRVLGIPADYEVLFLQGGASLQFAMVPLNLMLEGRPADVLHTGYWTKKAMDDLARVHSLRVAWSGEASRFLRLPAPGEIAFDPRACYVHLASNNTIEGTQWRDFPDCGGVPLVADMSSDILSRPVDVASFGLIFAGAQKNLGPSGLTLVVVRRDLLARDRDTLPSMLRYAVHARERSLYNTPPTFGVYLLELVAGWIESQGGLEAVARGNERKAALLYEELDANPVFECPVAAADRSRMNVVFLWRHREESSPEATAAREKRFLQAAAGENMVGLKGHRSVGGFRASLYNAVGLDSVRALVELLRRFAADEARLA